MLFIKRIDKYARKEKKNKKKKRRVKITPYVTEIQTETLYEMR